MKERGMSAEEAFGGQNMEEILRSSREAGGQPPDGDQKKIKGYRERENKHNPRLSKKQQRSLRRKHSS